MCKTPVISLSGITYSNSNTLSAVTKTQHGFAAQYIAAANNTTAVTFTYTARGRNMNYRLTIDSQTVVKENDDGTLVCFDPTDTTEKYQNEYQQWLDDGNTPQAAPDV